MAQGQLYLLGGDLSEEARQLMVSVHRLRSRVLDDQLRAEVGEFTALCTASGIPSAKYPKGKFLTIRETRQSRSFRCRQFG
jgi:hypothetical protein